MIAEQFLSWRFASSFVLALAIALSFTIAARHYNKTAKTQKFSASAIREPIGYMMSAIGVLVPLIAGGIAYLFNRDAAASYTLLLSAAAVLFVTFIVASWLTFSLTSRATDDDKIELTFPKDWPYRAASGVIYVGMVVGVLYVAWFFLVDFRAGAATHEAAAAPILLERAAPRIGQSRDAVRAQLGVPVTQEADGRVWRYRTDRSRLAVEFDGQGNALRITEER